MWLSIAAAPGPSASAGRRVALPDEKAVTAASQARAPGTAEPPSDRGALPETQSVIERIGQDRRERVLPRRDELASRSIDARKIGEERGESYRGAPQLPPERPARTRQFPPPLDRQKPLGAAAVRQACRPARVPHRHNPASALRRAGYGPLRTPPGVAEPSDRMRVARMCRCRRQHAGPRPECGRALHSHGRRIEQLHGLRIAVAAGGVVEDRLIVAQRPRHRPRRAVAAPCVDRIADLGSGASDKPGRHRATAVR
jgi:hypothetical protein